MRTGSRPPARPPRSVKRDNAITVDVVNGEAEVNLGKFPKKGKKKVEVQYLGSPALTEHHHHDVQGEEEVTIRND